MINNRLSSFFIRKSVIFYCVCISLAPEKKKQAESAVRYRVARSDPAPEKKKQAEFAARYRVASPALAPEKKKQAESAVRYRVTSPDPTPGKEEASGIRGQVSGNRV